MERRCGRQFMHLSKPKPAFERRIGRAQRKQNIRTLPLVKGGPAKAFTWDHFLFYVLFSFLFRDSPLESSGAFCGTFRGRFS